MLPDRKVNIISSFLCMNIDTMFNSNQYIFRALTLLKLCTLLLVYVSSGLARYDLILSISLYTAHLKMTH